MMFGGSAYASSALASQTARSTATSDTWVNAAINVTVNGISYRDAAHIDTLSIDETMGEQVTCRVLLVNPDYKSPVVGDVVEVRYYDQILFAGTIDRITHASNNAQTVQTWECTCTDWSQILRRYKIVRNFTHLPIVNIVTSLLEHEMAGEPLAIGTIDRSSMIPLVDSRGGSAFDLLRELAGITGQTFSVDFDKRIQFRATSSPDAPLPVDVTTVEHATLTTDREMYRNVQYAVVTGTPAAGTGAPALKSTQVRQNDLQIAERAAIEGGSGRYEDIEELTHPTSNDGADLALLGISYCQLRLATSGTVRRTLRCRVRGYGWRAGQVATVTIPHVGVSGTWLVQRVTITDEGGRRLVHDLELVESSLQQRVYESWLRMVSGRKITVQAPTRVTNNVQRFDTPGAHVFTVPADVTTVELTAVGASGAGGGSVKIIQPSTGAIYDWAAGGHGGNGGRAISIVDVVEGQILDIVVASGGATGGARASYAASVNPAAYAGNGTDASGNCSVKRGGVTLCQANGGGGGKGARAYQVNATEGAKGTDGNGIGDAVTVGGGKIGGAGGPPWTNGSAGQDGYVEVRW